VDENGDENGGRCDALVSVSVMRQLPQREAPLRFKSTFPEPPTPSASLTFETRVAGAGAWPGGHRSRTNTLAASTTFTEA